jgi:hypothetical protein
MDEEGGRPWEGHKPLEGGWCATIMENPGDGTSIGREEGMNKSGERVLWGSQSHVGVDRMCTFVDELGSGNGAIPPPLDQVPPDRRAHPDARDV